MLDAQGAELVVGDTVVVSVPSYSSHRSMSKGTVIAVNSKTIKVTVNNPIRTGDNTILFKISPKSRLIQTLRVLKL